MPEKIIILDPTLEVQTARVERAPRAGQVHTLGLLDNGKPNSDRLLNKIALLLHKQHPHLRVNYYRKPGAYRLAPGSLLDQVAAECDSVLVGIGD